MASPPDWTPIESSLFSHHRYDPNTRVMGVKMKNGMVYEHDDVPIEKHAAFIENQSPGRYWNQRIKPNHIGRKVKE